MFRRFGLYVAALSLLSVAPHLRSVKAEDAAPRPIRWRTDYAFANLEARTSGKPLFVVFRCER